MKVILHSDDFGFDKDTLEATIDCFEKGALTSATIMVNCEASEAAFEYARKHPEFSFGVHLTYVDGLKPVMPAKVIRMDYSSLPMLYESWRCYFCCPKHR